MKMQDIQAHAQKGGTFAFAAWRGKNDNGGQHAKQVEVLLPELLVPGSYITVRFVKDETHENEHFWEDGTRTSSWVNAREIRRTWEEHQKMVPIWEAEREEKRRERAVRQAEMEERRERNQKIIDRIEALKSVADDAGLEIDSSRGFYNQGPRAYYLKIKGLKDNEAVIAYLERLARTLP